MAKNKNAEQPEAAAETETTGEATTESKAAPSRDYPTGQELAEIVARKQAHGVLASRPWRMKGGTDIPSRFDKNEATQYEAKLGATPEETMQNMLAFAEDHQAVLDKFNAATRLEAQKGAKDAMGLAETDLAKVQEILDGWIVGAKRRGAGAGAGAKARAEKAEVKAKAAEQTANDILAELEAINPEAAAKYRERLASLGQ